VDTFIQALISGLIMGSVYAVMTMGLTLVYGCLRTLNMAQGLFGVAGGYVAWFIVSQAGLPSWLGVIGAALAGALLGVVTFYLAFRPLLGRKDVDFEMLAYITTLVVSIMLTSAFTLVFGARDKAIPPLLGGSLKITSTVSVTWHLVLVAVLALLILGALSLFLNRTRYGLSIIAVAQQMDAARLNGVSVQSVYIGVMALAGVLGGMAGVLLAPLYFISPTAGDLPLLKGLIIAIFAGLGSIRGTIYAALILGLFEALAATYVSSMWSLPLLFVLIVAVMLVRPYGLFGKPEEERL
jgi:branched-subunit amino acid ABC-type transport system permease component